MIRAIDQIACTNRWRNHSSAVALLCLGLMLDALLAPPLPGALVVILAALLLAVVGAKVPIFAYFRAMLVPLGFLVLGSLGLCWSLDWGESLSFAFCRASAATAVRAALRAWAATSVTLLFAFTVPIAQLVALLQRIYAPKALTELIHLTYRSLFLLDEACAAVLAAQRNRLGYRNATTALRSSGQAAASLFLRAILQSTRLQRGLTARGYNGRLVVLLPKTATRACHRWLALGAAALVGCVSWLCVWTWNL